MPATRQGTRSAFQIAAALLACAAFSSSAAAAVPPPATDAAAASVSDARGILLPHAGPNGSDVYLSDAEPDGRYRDPQLDPAAPIQPGAGVHPMDNGGTRHVETVTCSSAGFYRNYQHDDFEDLVKTYDHGSHIQVRDDEGRGFRRFGPRGVVVYMDNRWGFMNNGCLSGP